MDTEIALDGIEAYEAQAQELKDAWGRNTDLLQQLEAEKLMSHTLRHHLMSKEAELAASQAREAQLRKALHSVPICYHSKISGKECTCGSCESNHLVEKALALPQDTTAIEEMIAEAGEAMRERCAVECGQRQMAYAAAGYERHAQATAGLSDIIRALPSVTMEDLRK